MSISGFVKPSLERTAESPDPSVLLRQHEPGRRNRGRLRAGLFCSQRMVAA